MVKRGLMQNEDDASTSAGLAQTKRIYCREWRVQHRTIRATVSLPRLQLVQKDRPIFECPICFFSNDKVPICFWCRYTSPESTAAFSSSMPKQRTISAPVHMIYSNSFEKPIRPVAVDQHMSGPRAAAAEKLKPDKAVSVIYNQTCQKSFVPPSAPASVPPSSSRINRAGSARSALLRRSSYNSTTSTLTTCTTSSEETNPVTTPESNPPCHKQILRLRRVDDTGRQRITTSDILQREHHPQQQQQQQQQTDQSRRYHSLPLRRKGHFIRTTAGMIVKKTRLSALFRKDAVPILDATIEPSSSPHVRHVQSQQEKYKIRAEEEYYYRHHQHHRRSPSKRSQTIPTIPDSTVPLSPQAVSLMYSQAPLASIPSQNNNNQDHYGTITAPPSFLSPFWYRPDQYANLPSPPTSPPTSCSSRQTSVRNVNMTDRPDGTQCRPSFHSYTRSDPFPTFPRQQGSSRTWKTKMGGFFRTSINVVSGRYSR